MNIRTSAIIVGVLIVGIAASLWWKMGATPSYKVHMAPGEEVASWDFEGAYTGDAELEARARAEIDRLEGMLGSEEFPDYQLFVSIANQYGLLGDGKKELAYLEKALKIDATSTGLAWHNVGQLFARLGAPKTARAAFENAARSQPIPHYLTVLRDFLKERFPNDTTAIEDVEEVLRASTGETTI